MSEEQRQHEQIRKKEGPVSRRRRALRRLRKVAGRYRKRFLTAGGLALVLAVGWLLSAADVLSDGEAVPVATGRAGVMDTSHTAQAAPTRADSLRADSLKKAQQPPANADNTNVVEEVVEEVAEVVGRGEASYYGSELAGNPTASGEPFDPGKLTAAHRTLPLGSRVRVTNLRNDETVTVRINDRGPYHGQRILDLSRRAARHIDMLARGKARVKIELLKQE